MGKSRFPIKGWRTAFKRKGLVAAGLILLILLSGWTISKTFREPEIAEKRPTPIETTITIADTGSLIVLAGSASRAAVVKAVDIYERRTGSKVDVYFEGSGVLLSAMESAKRGDIYVSTSPEFMMKAQDEGAVFTDTVRPISFMNPAIVVHSGNPKKIVRLEDLAKPGVKVGMCDPKNCATGGYTIELLRHNNLLERIGENMAIVGDRYRDIVDKVAGNEVDAVIGWYVFDLNPTKLDFVILETEQIPKMGYISAGVSTYTEDRDGAYEFLNLLISVESREVYSKWGYIASGAPIEPVVMKEIDAFVGSATKPVMEELAEAFERKTGIKVNLHFGGSGTMLSEMKMSKRGELYIPASPDYMSKARRDGVVYSDTEKIITYLVPAIGVQKGNPKNIESLEDLGRPGVTVGICDPESCVIGEYAVEILESTEIMAKVKPNIVTHAMSASKTAALIPFGKVDAILIWRIVGNWNPEEMDIVLIDPDKIPRIAYVSGAVSTYAKDKESAKEFLNFLTSEEGREIFARWGYMGTEKEARRYAPEAEIGGEYILPAEWYKNL